MKGTGRRRRTTLFGSLIIFPAILCGLLIQHISRSSALESSPPYVQTSHADSAQRVPTDQLASPAIRTSATTVSKMDRLTASDGQYTIAWISDTQNYTGSLAPIFPAMTSFLWMERERLKLGYVAHTGDLVGKSSSREQWKNTRLAMDELQSLPSGVVAGNHDVAGEIGYDNFRTYFGENQYEDEPYYGGSLRDNRCHYDLITLGNTDFLFVYLGYLPGEESIRWANDVFQRYPDRVGVLCTHKYLDTDSDLNSMGIILQKEVVAKNPNLYLVLSGHRYTEDCIPVRFDDNKDGEPDRTVYQMIANYQELENGGDGRIRFLQIDEKANLIRFSTYSPWLDVFSPPPDAGVNPKTEMPIPWK